MKGIQSCLWFDGQAESAAKFYTSLFPNAKIARSVRYSKSGAKASGQVEGSTMTVEFELDGSKFLALNGGPHFKVNPAVSFFVGCSTEAEINGLWAKLCKSPRMELGQYPFAVKYGWCEDQFGVNWQLMLSSRSQKISPALLFANKKFGKAEEAIKFYTAQFPGSKIETIAKDAKTDAVLHSTFSLAEQSFVIMEGPLEPEFDFSPALSFVILCESQVEIDRIWGQLSAVPAAEQCGWLQDKYGVSWQVVHKDWGKMIGDSDPPTQDRLMAAILRMKKLDLKVLEQVYRQ